MSQVQRVRVLGSWNGTVAGLSRDWVTGNVYWIDERYLRLCVLSRDGKFSKVLYEGAGIFDKPRGLAVHPGLGQLFWTDWSDENPRIVRASMNGDLSSVHILLQGGDNLGWANGIALDIPENKVYWTDAKLNVIGAMNMDGTNKSTLPIGSHAFSIAVTEDFIYWSEWRESSILSVRKTNYSGDTIPKHVAGQAKRIALWGAKPKVKMASSLVGTSCPYLWLLGHNTTTQSAFGQCYCPDGFTAAYVNDQLECTPITEAGSKVTPNTTIKGECIVYSDRYSIRKTCMVGLDDSQLVMNRRNIVPLDVDFKGQCIYFTEILHQPTPLEVACLDPGTNSTRTFRALGNIHSTIEGMSRDWVTGNMYLVDRGNLRLEVLSNDGEFSKTLYEGAEIFDKPRGLAVHPGLGQLFWTDWSDENPRIVRASMNGDPSSVRILLQGADNLGWVNGIALDIPHNKIYWTDAKLDLIGSMNMDGTNRSTLFTAKHPYAIAVSKDFIYWSDWVENTITAVKKTDFSDVTLLKKTLTQPFGVAVWAEKPEVEMAPSFVRTSCPYLWLLGHNTTTQSAFGQCYCPDGFTAAYVNDQLECTEGNFNRNGANMTSATPTTSVAYIDSQTSSQSASVGGRQVLNCMSYPDEPTQPFIVQWKKEGVKDPVFIHYDNYPPHMDRAYRSRVRLLEHGGLELSQIRPSDEGWYECKIILLDGKEDASVNGSWVHLNVNRCPGDQFDCGNGRCISSLWVCDGKADCGNRADEMNCTLASGTTPTTSASATNRTTVTTSNASVSAASVTSTTTSPTTHATPKDLEFPFTFTKIADETFTQLPFACEPVRFNYLCPLKCHIKVVIQEDGPCLKCLCP